MNLQLTSLKAKNKITREIEERFFSGLFRTCLYLSVLFLLLITVYIFWNGLQLFTTIPVADFLLGLDWSPTELKRFGILPMIISSLYITLCSIALSAPIGIACAVCASELAKGPFRNLIQAAVQILAGTPSVVYGLIGLSVIVPWVQSLGKGAGFSMLGAIIILTIMILPTIVGISQSVIEAIPRHLKEASLALGASRFQTIMRVILPVAKPGLATAVVLGVSRAFGEAMAVKMVIGNRPTMPDFQPDYWFGLLSAARTLTTNIIGDIEYAKEGPHLQSLFATGAVLFLVIMLVNFCVYQLVKDSSSRRGNF